MGECSSLQSNLTCRLHSRPWSAFTVSCMMPTAASTTAKANANGSLPFAAALGASRNRSLPPEAVKGARPPRGSRLRVLQPRLLAFAPASAKPGVESALGLVESSALRRRDVGMPRPTQKKGGTCGTRLALPGNCGLKRRTGKSASHKAQLAQIPTLLVDQVSANTHWRLPNTEMA